MAVFTFLAAAAATAIGLTGTAATIFTAIGATVLSIGVSSLVAKRMAKSGLSGGPGGGRVQLPPATDNKIPVVYGQAFLGGPVIDAKISTDLKKMWYVIALAEHTDTTAGSGYTFDTSNIYYDGKKVQFGSNGVVTGLINNTPGQTEIDTKVNGKIFIYLFTNGSSSGINTGGQTAIQILQNSAIPASQRWTSTDTMTNCAFAIVQVTYDDKAGTTSLGGLMCKITNSLDKPGSVIKDYLTNTRYGCAIPLSRIDTASLTALDTYSDETINYGTGTQARYRINGPVQTGETCLNNLNYLVDSCDSWLQYSELTAKWSVVINKPYSGSITNLFLVDSDNLIGGINIAPINLNETYNQLEVAYPNQYIKDQTDYQVIKLEDYQAGVMSPNEAINKLNIDYPYVNNSVQALYLGVRKLLQSREDLTCSFRLDYSGIQIDAGDVIRIKHDGYGWDVLNSGEGKLFRVASVAEEKYQDGSLGVFISAFEYNGTIYDDRALLNFQPDPNTGLTDPNIFGNVAAPIVNLFTDGTINYMEVKGTVPVGGLVRYLDYNYGYDSNVSNHFYYTTITNGNGEPLVSNTVYTINVNDVPIGNLYWSLTAKNDQAGQNSNATGPINWVGATVTQANTANACNASSTGTLITCDAIPNLSAGGLVTKTSGTGTLQANTRVANVISNTQFYVTLVPTVDLSNACIQITGGGITGNNIQANTVTGNNIASNTITSNNLANSGVTAGTYTLATVTVNSKGLVTSASNGTAGGNIAVLDEANTITNAVSSFNFTGTGVTVTSGGGNSVVVTIPGGNATSGAYAYVNDRSFALAGGVNPPDAINQKTSYGAARIPANNQANISTGNFEALVFDSYYPWYDETSDTTNGYLANSTAVCTPDNAGIQDLGTAVSLGGRAGWWTVIGAGIDSGNRVANAQFNNYSSIQVYPTANMTVQVAGWYKQQQISNTANISNAYKPDTTITCVELVANRPQILELDWDVEGNSTYAIYDMGMCVRAIGSGNLIVLMGKSLTTKPNSWDYANIYWIR